MSMALVSVKLAHSQVNTVQHCIYRLAAELIPTFTPQMSGT